MKKHMTNLEKINFAHIPAWMRKLLESSFRRPAQSRNFPMYREKAHIRNINEPKQ